MIIARKPLARRTLLRGVGAVLSLPLLEAMTPTRAKAADAAATARKRLQVMYTPNGMAMDQFFPKQAGEGYEITPVLKPLEPYRDRFMVISNLDHVQAEALGDGAGDHGRSCGTYLTGVHVKKTEGADLMSGVSMDQLVAKQFGRSTQIPSLELSLDPPSLVGSCDSGYSCAYTNTMSWANATTPLPVTINPRDVFERLFGDGEVLDPQARMARMRRQASILDFVADDAKRLSGSMGVNDRRKLDEYMESVRSIETRIQKAEQGGSIATPLPGFGRPSGIPDAFEDYSRMMIDLQVLAMQADLTRVGTFMIGREGSTRSYPEIDVPDAHHPLSHHGNDPAKLARLAKVNTLHFEQVAYYMKRMSETKEGDGSLLDSTMLLAGSSLADPNQHNHRNLPTILGGGLVKGGNRHLVVAEGTPMTNLMLSMMDILGVHQDKLGDSTGRISGLA
jgi:hypothetical protein